jgi:hypothetical protein
MAGQQGPAIEMWTRFGWRDTIRAWKIVSRD